MFFVSVWCYLIGIRVLMIQFSCRLVLYVGIKILSTFTFSSFGLLQPHPVTCIYIYIYIYIYIQWVRKVFRPPYIFHSLLYCSHLLKSFQFIFFLINVHTAPHIDRKTQNCWHFCRFIKKEKLKYHMVLSIQTLCSVFSRSTLLI